MVNFLLSVNFAFFVEINQMLILNTNRFKNNHKINKALLTKGAKLSQW